jgi:hypothetical protein
MIRPIEDHLAEFILGHEAEHYAAYRRRFWAFVAAHYGEPMAKKVAAIVRARRRATK